jgi:predicted pyridoxine 5'-phosphate oxidase superfamily flavin-nucleotide-binding protein
MSPPLLSAEVAHWTGRSVLCWLASVDAAGQPSVAPKEIYAVFDETHIVIAHIASPQSVANIAHSPRVCVSCCCALKIDHQTGDMRVEY